MMCILLYEFLPKIMDYSLWSSAIFGKNVTGSKNHFQDMV